MLKPKPKPGSKADKMQETEDAPAIIQEQVPTDIKAAEENVESEAIAPIVASVISGPDDSAVPEALMSKISEIAAGRGSAIYVDDFDRSLIPISGIPSDNITYGVHACGMPLKTHDLFMIEPMEENESVADRVIDTIITKYTNIRARDMLEGDIPYVLMWLRENTFPDCPLTYTFSCRKCGRRHVSKTVGLDDAIFNKLPEWYRRGHSINVDGSVYNIVPSTRGRKIDKDIYIANAKKKLDQGDLHVLEMATYIDAPLNIAIAKIENINPQGLPKLYSAVESMKRFGFSGKFNVKCEGCSENNIALFRFRKRFYIPEVEGYRLDEPTIQG